MKEKNNPFKNRRNMTKIMMLLTGLTFLLFAYRFSSIMITKKVNGENLSEHVNNLYTRSSILAAKRGSIYDIGGNPIAMDATSYSLLGVLTDEWNEDKDNPQHIIDKEKTAQVLSTHIDMSKTEILNVLQQENVNQVEFGRAGVNLSYSTKADIEEEELPGIVFVETPSRLYPNGIFASHLVGYAAVDKEDEEENEELLTGMMGIEQAYDSMLKGQDGKTIAQKDSQGYTIPHTEMVLEEPVDGKDIYLTLDTRLQIYLETLMTKVYEEAEPEAMVATLVNPKTGAVVAATQRPTFNATTMEGIDSKWQNLLIEESFEPGSTFKILTIAAAINEGIFRPNDTFMSGSINVEGGTIHDFNVVGWGEISYLEGFARSSNVMVVKLVEQMGFEVWEEYMKSFGIATATKSGLLNEATGDYNYNYPLEKVNTSFGQGVTVTPFQLIQAFTSVANDGKMMKLQYISKIVDSVTGEEKVMEPEEISSPISKETAETVLNYLTEVVYADYGTASAYQIEDVRIGAKTGTAELVNAETGKYYTGWNEYLYSVVGFAPIDDPSYILYVTLKLPKNVEEKSFSTYLSEVFNPMLTRAVAYDELGAENTQESYEGSIPKVTSMNKQESIDSLAEHGFYSVSVIGSGSQVVQQYPFAGTNILLNQRVVLMTEGAMTMPDVHGWSKDDVLKISELTGTPFQFVGEGYVVDQGVLEGAVLNPDEPVKIILE
ncbi:penicillin-binding protein [Jeotgalibaca sp. MA1X17-3]|uniref:penicillin-binding protein n=1 Tax=Jeotgalibaca sp. MA1X17-3 TaxID=2908211 RepID=UPI001F1AD897|nr:penicillin-binding protein [Jeotgalibaca sp. MA1X17-3]UJF15128.1 penicillin-binding protein [Jeotgalibaca sp. MA1X17-3]